MLNYALDYIKRGWFVFPLKGKIPFEGLHGYKDAVCDENKARKLWAKYPGNPGIATGRISGFFVFDVDTNPYKGKVGKASLDALEAEHGALPTTVEASTWSGGRHLFYKYPTRVDIMIGCSVGRIGKDLDIRGDKGHIVGPGGVYAEDGRQGDYEWVNDPDDYDMVDPPDWLVEKAMNSGEYEKFQLPDGGIPTGQRDDILYRMACSLVSQNLPDVAVHAALREALKTCEGSNDFSDRDIKRWIVSAHSYIKNPVSRQSSPPPPTLNSSVQEAKEDDPKEPKEENKKK